MLTPYHTTNRTATTNGPISLAYTAGLGKYGYGNGIVVTERISGTVLEAGSFVGKSGHNIHRSNGPHFTLRGFP